MTTSPERDGPEPDGPTTASWASPRPWRWTRRSALITAGATLVASAAAGTVLAHAGDGGNTAAAACAGVPAALARLQLEQPQLTADQREVMALTSLAQDPHAPADVRAALLILSRDVERRGDPADQIDGARLKTTEEMAAAVVAALPGLLRGVGESLDRIQGHINDLQAACARAGTAFLFPAQDILVQDGS